MFADLAVNYPLLLVLGTVPVFACIGGIVVTFLVYRLGSTANGTSVSMMLLAGVAIAALAGAALGLLNYFADDQALRDLSLWTMGSLAGANTNALGLAFVTLIVLFIAYYRDANKLNAMLLGESEARHMGINVQNLKTPPDCFSCRRRWGHRGSRGDDWLYWPHRPSPSQNVGWTELQKLATCQLIIRGIATSHCRYACTNRRCPARYAGRIVTALLGAPFFIGLLIKQKGRL